MEAVHKPTLQTSKLFAVQRKYTSLSLPTPTRRTDGHDMALRTVFRHADEPISSMFSESFFFGANSWTKVFFGTS